MSSHDLISVEGGPKSAPVPDVVEDVDGGGVVEDADSVLAVAKENNCCYSSAAGVLVVVEGVSFLGVSDTSCVITLLDVSDGLADVGGGVVVEDEDSVLPVEVSNDVVGVEGGMMVEDEDCVLPVSKTANFPSGSTGGELVVAGGIASLGVSDASCLLGGSDDMADVAVGVVVGGDFGLGMSMV